MEIEDKMEQGPGNEKGFILILALVTMVMMTVIGISLVMNITTDMQLARNEREAKIAFQLANAGMHEAIARLHLTTTNARYVGEPASTDPNYRKTTWPGFTFNSDTALIGSLGTNRSYAVAVKYLDETNPEGLCDSNTVSPNTSGNALTYPSTWTCNNTPPEIVMYGRDFKLSNTLTSISYGKLPVYIITSTGTSNGTTRTINAYIGASSLNTDTNYGLNTNSCINIAGGANNLGTVEQGAGCGCDAQINGACAANKASSDDMTTYLGEQLSAVIDMADEKHKCQNVTCSAAGDDIPTSGKIDSVVSDWGVIAGQANTHATMIYINNADSNYVNYNGVEISGNQTGRGILIVTGDLKLTGTLTYQGLIYVFGTLTISGGGSSLNVTGGIMANKTVSVNGNVTVQYDQATLLDVARQNSSEALVLWKRM